MDAAESNLEGDVSPRTAHGAIRYRIWPARRHPIRTLLFTALLVGATTWAWVAFETLLWPLVVFTGLTATGAIFFFPTLVALDGPTLNVRQFGLPRAWDLRDFKRMERSRDILPRVELSVAAGRGPMDRARGVTIPLPGDVATAERVTLHLQRWVSRRRSGVFELDADMVPEDHVTHEDSRGASAPGGSPPAADP